MQDPVKLIKEDHQTVKKLFRRFEAATRKSQRQQLAQEIIEELSVHATIEEQLVYPALRRSKKLEEPVLDALEEHHTVKLVLAELDKMDADDERFDAKMHVVQESVEHHIEMEERDLLPRLHRALDRKQLEQLAARMVQMKGAAPNQPHPRAPDTPPGNFVAGAFAKVADLGRDVMHKVTNRDRARGHRQVRARASTQAHAAKRATKRGKMSPRGSRATPARGGKRSTRSEKTRSR